MGIDNNRTVKDLEISQAIQHLNHYIYGMHYFVTDNLQIIPNRFYKNIIMLS